MRKKGVKCSISDSNDKKKRKALIVEETSRTIF
jgi:hypothetical protein